MIKRRVISVTLTVLMAAGSLFPAAGCSVTREDTRTDTDSNAISGNTIPSASGIQPLSETPAASPAPADTSVTHNNVLIYGWSDSAYTNLKIIDNNAGVGFESHVWGGTAVGKGRSNIEITNAALSRVTENCPDWSDFYKRVHHIEVPDTGNIINVYDSGNTKIGYIGSVVISSDWNGYTGNTAVLILDSTREEVIEQCTIALKTSTLGMAYAILDLSGLQDDEAHDVIMAAYRAAGYKTALELVREAVFGDMPEDGKTEHNVHVKGWSALVYTKLNIEDKDYNMKMSISAWGFGFGGFGDDSELHLDKRYCTSFKDFYLNVDYIVLQGFADQAIDFYDSDNHHLGSIVNVARAAEWGAFGGHVSVGRAS